MNKPKLSVIVPIYNVEKYLAECIQSLLNQTLKDIEIILVNDGSKDESGKIADYYAENFENVTVYHKVNGGLGQARNYGMQFANGDYIAFVDSDDYLTEDAYQKLYNSISKTGSDIAIGNVVRFNSTKVYPSVLHQKVFTEDKVKAHISRDPELINDTTAWNKIFKKAFWDNHQLTFPEGMLYEDLPVTIPAHFLASSVDVISDVIYYWRARDNGDQSITQQRTDLKNLTDRLKAVKMVDDYFSENVTSQELNNIKDYKMLSTDLLVYLNQLDVADDDYIVTYLDEVSNYLETVNSGAFNKLKAIDRLKYYFVKKKDKEKLLDVLSFQKTKLKYSKIEKFGEDYYGNYPYKDEVPKEFLKVTNELIVKRKIESMKWTENNLTIKGFCYIKDIDIKQRKQMSIKATLMNEETGETVKLENLRQKVRKDITNKFGVDISDKLPLKRLYNYDWSGWELDIDFSNPNIFNMSNGKMAIILTLNAGGVEREISLGSPVKGRVSKPKYRIINDSVIFLKYNAAWDLVIQKDELLTKVNRIELTPSYLKIIGFTKLPLLESQLCLKNYRVDKELLINLEETVIDKDSNFEANILISDLGEANIRGEWFGHIFYDNEYTPLTTDIELYGEKWTLGENELKISHSPAGNLYLPIGDFTVDINEVKYDEKNILLHLLVAKGYISENSDCQLVLKNNKLNEEVKINTRKIEQSDEKVILKAIIEPLSLQGDLSEGTWGIYLENHDKTRLDRVIFDLENIDRKSRTYRNIKYVLKRTKKNNKASLVIKREWSWIERGPRRQEIIKKVLYPLMRYLPKRNNSIVFESYWGKSFNCNPRALYEYIDENYKDFESIWFLKNTETRINGSGKKIRINSLKYYYYLATAKYFVNNVNFPDFYKKRSGSKELQTMHGTPLKTLGLDVPGDVDTEPKRSKYLNRCSRWDYLTVPSDYVEDIAKRAFEYDQEVLKVGYPRNDRLFTNNNVKFIDTVKSELNIPLNKKIVLYAPTWRIKNKFNVEMDLEKLKRELGDEYIILFKLHHFVADSVQLPNDEFVYNVSKYDDIRDLYLISDMLITDYSSVMFDYAILDKPQIIFAYDLDNYRNNLRGMYLDITEYAPGPITKDTDELIRAIKNIEKYEEEYAIQISRFKEKFCQYDDGHASERITAKFLK
ncbi:CDP-glycerol glycerophosphotransferase family protein [Cytobacillus sp. FSL M8-0252]|uniref:CDP-glycerol glycerophosphotransferase family protein n=1 Tax=Cytobacillus sp. FSL M8-0252 TaxID=2921621 RepID=UPI0030F676A1